MTKVTDQALLKMLNEGSGKVSDPSLLSKLNSSDPIDSTVGVMKPQAWDNAVPNYVALAPTKSAGRGQRMPDLGTQHNPFPRNQYGSANEGDFVKNQDGSTRKKVMSFAEKRLAEGENAFINLKSQAEGLLPSNIIKSASDKVSQIDATGGYYIDNGGMSIYVPASEDESSILKETMKPQLSQLGSIQTKYDLQRQNVPLSIDRAKFNEEFENSEGLLGATKAIVTNPTAGAGFLAESLGGSAPAIAMSALTRNPFALMAISGASGYEQELATGIAGYLDTHGYPRETWDSLPEDIIKSAVDETSTRALVVGGVETIGGKVASKAYVPRVIANSPTKAAILNPMAQGVAGGVIDATGEATAQLASGQPYNPQEIVAEAGGGLLSQPVESLQSTVHAMKLQGKNFVEVASNEELLDIATNPTSPKDMALEASLGLMNRGMAIDNNGKLVTSAEANAQPTQPLGEVGQPTVPTPVPVAPEAPEPVPVEVPTVPPTLGEITPVAPTVPSVDDVFGKPTQPPVQEPVQQGDTTTPPLTCEVTVPVAQPTKRKAKVAPPISETPLVGANTYGISETAKLEGNADLTTIKRFMVKNNSQFGDKGAIKDLYLVKKKDVPSDFQQILDEMEIRGGTPLRLIVSKSNPKLGRLKFGGFHVKGKGIYLMGDDRNGDFVPSLILFHELNHNMRIKDPDLHKRLADFVKNNTSETERAAFAIERKYAHLDEDGRLEEQVSDLVGEAMSDRKYLKLLADKDPTLFKDLVEKLIKFMDDFVARVKALHKNNKDDDAGGSKYLQDIEGFRNELADVLIEHHKRGLARHANGSAKPQQGWTGSPNPINNKTSNESDTINESKEVTSNEQEQTKNRRESDKGRSDSTLPTKTDEGKLQDGRGVGGKSELLANESGKSDKSGAEALRTTPKTIGEGTTLKGLPTNFVINGQEYVFGGHKVAQDVARQYMKDAGMEYNPPSAYVKVDKDRATKIASLFENGVNDPTNPIVAEAYQAMIDETLAQYEALLKTGITIEFEDGIHDYGNPRNMIIDVVENNHMWVFPTDEGFGSSDADNTGNPLLAKTKYKISGKVATANDIFRVVHDYFGHVANGVGFRATGEENAWVSHMAMYSPLAGRAVTSETRGQNSVVNYGSNAEHNRTASGADTIYAEQKILLLPEWVSNQAYDYHSKEIDNEQSTTNDESRLPRVGEEKRTDSSLEEGEGIDLINNPTKGKDGKEIGSSADWAEIPSIPELSDIPVFTDRKRMPNAVSALGVHYSGEQGLTTLDSTYAGTGSAGRERRRFGAGNYAKDAKKGDTRRRLYFYIQTSDAIPVKENVVAGHNAYTVVLDNLYDVVNDPDGLAKQSMNTDHFEESVADAGYDGVLYPPQSGIESPIAILFGIGKKVPVLGVEIDKVDFINETPKKIESSKDWSYSALARMVDGAPLKTVSAEQWKNWIKGNATKNGVKADELEWTGINEWLALQEGKVSKEAVQAYLDANGVQVTEVQKGYTGSTELPYGWEIDKKLDNGSGSYYYLVFDGNGDLKGEGDSVEEATLNATSEGKTSKSLPKFDDPNWRVAGGKNYREVVLTLPNTKTKFQSSHWDEANVLAHIRLGEHTDADGNKILFVYEIQSDWGQRGRKLGFKQPTDTALWQSMFDDIDKKFAVYLNKRFDDAEVKYPDNAFSKKADRDLAFQAVIDHTTMERKAEQVGMETEYYRAKELRDDGYSNDDKAPKAPFVTDTKAWVALAIKRVTAMAVEEGFDKVVFASGQQAADYFDLSKSVSRIAWDVRHIRSDEKLVAISHNAGEYYIYIDKDGKVIEAKGNESFVGKPLDEIIGKDVAKKIVTEETGELTDDGLKIGGEGMKAFYDKLVPQVANDVLKKLGGGKVDKIVIAKNDEYQNPRVASRSDGRYSAGIGIGDSRVVKTFDTEEEADSWIDEQYKLLNEQTQLGFTITDGMKSKVEDGDIPLFINDQTSSSKVKDAVKESAKLVEGNRSFFTDSITSRAQALEKKVPELHKVFKKVVRYAGEDKRSTQTYSEYVEQRIIMFTNRIEKIIHDAFGHDKDLTNAENDQLRDAILGLPVADQAIADAGKKINHETKILRDDAEALGIDIGEVMDIGYLPRVYKSVAIHENPQGFKDDAFKHFRDHEFEREFGDSTTTYIHKVPMARYIGLLRNFRSSPTIAQALKDVRVQTRKIRTSNDPIVRQQAFAEAVRLLESVRSEAKDLYAEQRASAWANGARMQHNKSAYEPKNGLPRPTKDRVLSGQADITMKDWLEQDVRNLMHKLALGLIPKMGLHNAYGKDPLKALDSALNNLVLDNKITLRQRIDADELLDDALGLDRQGIKNPDAKQGANFVHALGYTSLLERAVFPSLSEASHYAFRSDSMKDIIAPLRQLARVMFNQKDKAKTKEIALLLGVITRNASATINLHRIGHQEGDFDGRLAEIMHGFFRLNFLQTLTDDQRVLGVRIGTEAFKRWAKQHQNGSKLATSFLDELGVQDTDAFAKWILSLPDMPEQNDLFDVDGRMTPMGAEFSTALNRFISGAIQNPDTTLKPAFAAHPVGRYFAGIMSFAFSVYENIFKREAKILARVKGGERAQRLARIALPTLTTLFIAQTLSSALRMILDGKDPDDDDFWEEAIHKGVANTIGVGMFNQVANYITGLKYETTASQLAIGAVFGYFTGGIDNINAPLSARNSDNTESAEYKAGKGLYDVVVAPAATALLSVAPSQYKWFARMGLAVESSKQARERFAEIFGVPPERENSTDKKFKDYSSGSDKAKELVTKKLGGVKNYEQWQDQFDKTKAEYPELLDGYNLKTYADNAENNRNGKAGMPRKTTGGKPMLEGEGIKRDKDALKEISVVNGALDDLRKSKDATYEDLVALKPYSATATKELEGLSDDDKNDEISRSLKIKVINETMAYRTDIKKNIMKQKE